MSEAIKRAVRKTAIVRLLNLMNIQHQTFILASLNRALADKKVETIPLTNSMIDTVKLGQIIDQNFEAYDFVVTDLAIALEKDGVYKTWAHLVQGTF